MGVTMKYLLISCLMLLSGCTYSVTLVHTSGSASDVIDETSTPSTSVSPTINVPMKAI